MIKTIVTKSKINKKEYKIQNAKLWIDEYPNIECDFDDIFSETFELSKFMMKKSKKICIEISLLRHASNYALLGMEYTPVNGPILHVEIPYNKENKDRHISDIGLMNQEYKYCGLLSEHVNAVFEEVEKFYENNIGCAGKITFNISANCEVGSSKMIFQKATLILLTILCSDIIDDDQIKKILQDGK